jgi:hypothetical protein
MLIVGSGQRRFLKWNIWIIFLVMISSCGMPGNENRSGMTKEMAVGINNANLATSNGGETIKDPMAANTEKATFALG